LLLLWRKKQKEKKLSAVAPSNAESVEPLPSTIIGISADNAVESKPVLAREELLATETTSDSSYSMIHRSENDADKARLVSSANTAQILRGEEIPQKMKATPEREKTYVNQIVIENRLDYHRNHNQALKSGDSSHSDIPVRSTTAPTLLTVDSESETSSSDEDK
jgi:hypothetical protein